MTQRVVQPPKQSSTRRRGDAEAQVRPQNQKSKIKNPKSIICLLGGTFDPPHIGHLVLAEAVRDKFRLERVTLLPAALSPLKGRTPTPAIHRFAMLRRAIRGNTALDIDDRELRREQKGVPSYTIDTVEELLAKRPGSSIILVIGADQLAKLHQWREAQRLVKLARFAVALRPPFDAGVFDAVRKHFPAGVVAQLKRDALHMPQLDISSTSIRARVREGHSIRYMVPLEVARYIARHGLYRA